MSNDKAGYYQKVRRDLIPYIDKAEGSSILELGCAEGWTGAYLKKESNVEFIMGVDVFAPAIEVAQKNLDEAICVNLETFDIKSVGNERFDYILCGDVLEHLHDPWRTVADLHGLLKKSGKLIVSLPNTQHYSVSVPLVLKGEWKYESAGILDKTHLRFFTKKSMRRLYDHSQYNLLLQEPLFWGRRDPLINRLTFGLIQNLIAPMWILLLQRK